MTGKKIVAADLAAATTASTPPPLPPFKLDRRFEMRADGLYRLGSKGENPKPDLFVCSPFEVLTETRDPEQGGWGLLLKWRDRDGRVHEEAMARALFTGEGAELRSRLADGGLSLSPRNDARSAFVEYLSAINSTKRAVIVQRIGWHRICGRRVFVLADETFGVTSERVILQTPSRELSSFCQGGSLDGWKAEIAARCAGNGRLVLAVCCGFAPTMLDLLGEDGGGVHLHGRSRAGKTTLLRVAASVCGGNAETGAGAFVRTWRSTGNAIEGTAAAHSDSLLCLDEISQADGRDIGETAYLLGNGAGKARLDRSAGLRAPMRFRTLFLSSGEQTLAAKIAESGKAMRAGMEVRMIDLPAEPAGRGVFETWSIDGSAEAMARALADAVRRHYGKPLRAFLHHLVKLLDAGPEVIDELKAEVEARVARWVSLAADAQVRTVCRRFALIAAAGEIATEAGITGWAKGECEQAILSCFTAWLVARGSSGAREELQAVAALRRFMSTNGSSRFEDWREALQDVPGGDSQPPSERFRTVNRAGWRRWETDVNGHGAWRHYLTADGMGAALDGLDYRAALAALVERGFILPGNGGRSSRSMTVTGYGKQRLYVVDPSIISATGSAGDADPLHGEG